MSLTEVSVMVRKYAPYVLLIGLIVLIIFYSIKLLFIVAKNNQPTIIPRYVEFQKIPSPQVKDFSLSSDMEFTLDTVEGVPVTATDTARVFHIPKTTPKFGYREKIYLIAKTFGFDTSEITHTMENTIATFIDDIRELKIDIVNYNFQYNEKFTLNPTVLFPSKKEIENKAINFLKTINRYPDELAKGSIIVTYLKYNAALDTYVNVDRPYEAQAVEVDFIRSDIDGFSTVTPKFFTSSNYVIMTFDEFKEKIIKAQISFYDKADEQYGVYPIKTGSIAWDQLKNGKGLVVAGQQGKKKIVIKDMKLAYLDPDFYQDYIQPVYVFIGDNDFVGYVPAIDENYLID